MKNLSAVLAGYDLAEDPATLRGRYAMALKGAARLGQLQLVDARGKAALKDLILRNDRRVMAAVEVFEVDHDVEEMLDTLKRIARRAVADL